MQFIRLYISISNNKQYHYNNSFRTPEISDICRYSVSQFIQRLFWGQRNLQTVEQRAVGYAGLVFPLE
jgi:hypothetical protein